MKYRMEVNFKLGKESRMAVIIHELAHLYLGRE